MDHRIRPEPALGPDELPRLILERLNAADVEGIVALYEPDAVLVAANEAPIQGETAIRSFYSQLLAEKPQFQPGVQRCTIRHGDIALTSSRLSNGSITVEVAHLQKNGTWLWIIDNPMIAREVQ